MEPGSKSIDPADQVSAAGSVAEFGGSPADSSRTSTRRPVPVVYVLFLIAVGFGTYQYVLHNFWSSESLGIHDRLPWPSYLLLAAALIVSLWAMRASLGVSSPHVRLGIWLLAFLSCLAVGISGGRFISYTLRGTLNPPFKVKAAIGDPFPVFALPDQKGVPRPGPISPGSRGILIVVYRGDFCPFARHEIASLNQIQRALKDRGVEVVAMSADPIERSKMLASYLSSAVPLLSDEHEKVLGPLGLVQRHRDGEPDNAIPAYFMVGEDGKIRWIFAPSYYRQLPRNDDLVAVAQTVANSAPRKILQGKTVHPAF